MYLAGQIGSQRLTTHKGHDRTRGIEGAALAALLFFQQVFKHLAQHLRVERDLHFERRILLNREVMVLQEVEQPLRMPGIKERVCEHNGAAVIVFVWGKQATIEIGHPAKARLRLRSGLIQRVKEERLQNVPIEILLLSHGFLVPVFDKLVGTVECPLLLQKIEEHQPAKEPLGEGMQPRGIGKCSNGRVILLDALLRRPEASGVLAVEGISEGPRVLTERDTTISM